MIIAIAVPSKCLEVETISIGGTRVVVTVAAAVVNGLTEVAWVWEVGL